MLMRVGFVLTMLCGVCSSQRSDASPALDLDLQAKRWIVRRDAFERIAGNPAVYTDPHLISLLIQLRDRENDTSELSKVDLFEDDEYLAYDDQLADLVQKIAVRTKSSAAWRSLVYMRYNSDSITGHWLADHLEAIPFIEDQLHDKYAVRRATAIGMLVNILNDKHSENLMRNNQKRSWITLMRSAARHESTFVRVAALNALAEVGGANELDLLKRIGCCSQPASIRPVAVASASRLENRLSLVH